VSAADLVGAIRDVAAINPRAEGPRIHPEQARRVVELAFLGLVAAWDEFLEQSFVRYLAGAKSSDGSSPSLRLGKAHDIAHAYHIISGDPAFDPTKNYSRFSDTRWVIDLSKIYFERGSPYATALHPNHQVLQHATRLRNRVAHNSTKSREDFKRTARALLGRPQNAPLTQGYGVGDLLLSPAILLFGQEARDRNMNYFQAFGVRFLHLAALVCPEA
jgi:hypothetical protein